MVSQNTVKGLRKVTSHVNFRPAYSSSHSSHFQKFSFLKVCQVSQVGTCGISTFDLIPTATWSLLKVMNHIWNHS